MNDEAAVYTGPPDNDCRTTVLWATKKVPFYTSLNNSDKYGAILTIL